MEAAVAESDCELARGTTGMKVLLVDDDASKVQLVASALRKVDGIALDIDTAQNAAQAKRALLATQYDLLVLDVALPQNAESHPNPKGGLELLSAIGRGRGYIKPREIVGLTAYESLLAEAGQQFSSQLWTLIHFDRASDAWAEKLRTKIRYLVEADQKTTDPEYASELCVVTALHDPELKAVLRLPWGWTKCECCQDSAEYWEGRFRVGDDHRRVIAASATKMGMTYAASLAMKMVHRFRPKFLAMVGIAAGVKGKCSLGDAVAADPCWDWGSGKFRITDKGTAFEPAPEQLSLNAFIRTRIKALSQNSAALDRVRSEWTGDAIGTVLHLHLAPMASGASVLADGVHSSLIQSQQRKVVGIDMEAYAIFAVADESPKPLPTPFVIKGIVDYADGKKSDSHHAYAAYVSANLLRLLMEN